MKWFAPSLAGLLTALATLMPAPAPAAPVGQTWIASIPAGGTDANPCTREAPCLTLETAYAQTSPGGKISCVDSFQITRIATLTISHSLTIDCRYAPLVLLSVTNDFLIVNAGAADTVILRGLELEGLQQSGSTPGLSGVNFTGGGTLDVQDCTFRKFTTAGINFAPSGLATLAVTDSVFQANGSGSTGAGILVRPAGGGGAQVVFNRVTAAKNVFGIAVDGTGSSAGINMTVTDSVSGGNKQDGIIAVTPSGGAPIGMLVTNSRSVNNNIGIRSIGPNVTVRVNSSDIAGNGTGLSFSTGGSLLSFGNNRVRANGSDGAFSGSVGLQ